MRLGFCELALAAESVAGLIVQALRYRDRSAHCRVNDRGPLVKGRVIDVSLSAARALGMIEAGVVLVSVHDE